MVVGRKGREVARLHGEVVGPVPPMARPLPSRTPDGQPVVLREVHHHHHAAPAPVEQRSPVPGWVRVAALVMCIVLAVYVLLIVMAFLHTGPSEVPWQPKGGVR